MASAVVSQLVYDNFRPRVRRSRKLDRLFPPCYNMPKMIYSRENNLQCHESLVVEVEITEVIETARVAAQITAPPDVNSKPTENGGTKPAGEKRKPKIGKWHRLWNHVIHGRVEKSYTNSAKKELARNGTVKN